MKGNSPVKIINKIFAYLVKLKNKQINAERLKICALEQTNSILSAYVSIFIDEQGEVRIPKMQIRDAIGQYSAKVIPDGSDYVIRVEKLDPPQSFFSEDEVISDVENKI